VGAVRRRGGAQDDYWGFLQEAHQIDGPWIFVSMTGYMTVLHAIIASEQASKLMSLQEAIPMPTTRTTVALPADLLRGIDAVVRSGRAATRNEFLATAIRRELDRIRREAVDREFEAMADDLLYQREAREISDEYRFADSQALRVAEDDS
jgi:Arc/MetJ-type ribon-helix-helix transcriptional regulator